MPIPNTSESRRLQSSGEAILVAKQLLDEASLLATKVSSGLRLRQAKDMDGDWNTESSRKERKDCSELVDFIGAARTVLDRALDLHR